MNNIELKEEPRTEESLIVKDEYVEFTEIIGNLEYIGVSKETEQESLIAADKVTNSHKQQESSENIPFASTELLINCGICQKGFYQLHLFVDHCKSNHHNKIVTITCGNCGISSRQFKNINSFKSHHKYIHKLTSKKCPYCDKIFSPKSLNYHIRSVHPQKGSYRCNKCRKVFCRELNHKCNVERDFPDENSFEKCSICNKNMRKSYLSQHLRYHQIDKSYMCEICGIFMHNRGNFIYHQDTHKTDKSRHLCEICGKSFKTRRVLKKHYTIHTGTGKVKCTICDSTLSNVRSLKTHMKTHQEARPFQCKFCGKGFKHPGHKTAHERIHTGERPYQCKICPSAFYEAGNLIKHMKKVHSNGKTSNKKFKFDSANNETAELIDPSRKEDYIVLQKFENIL